MHKHCAGVEVEEKTQMTQVVIAARDRMYIHRYLAALIMKTTGPESVRYNSGSKKVPTYIC